MLPENKNEPPQKAKTQSSYKHEKQHPKRQKVSEGVKWGLRWAVAGTAVLGASGVLTAKTPENTALFHKKM